MAALPPMRCADGPLSAALCADLDAARDYARQSLSPATRLAYEGDWRAFQSWCTDRGIAALPTSPTSVAAWLAAQAERGLRPATIARRCAAVRHYHRLAGIDPLPTDAAVVKTTMKGLRRSLGAAQAKKAPATNVVAQRMADSIPSNSLKGRRDRAMVMLGFARCVPEIRSRRTECRGPGVLRGGRSRHHTAQQD